MRTTHGRRGTQALLAVAAAGSLVLSGCASQQEGDTSVQMRFTLGYSVANSAESPYAAMAEAYMQAHPDVTIDLEPQPFDKYGENLRVQLQSGNAPDVIQTTPGRGQPQSVLTLAEAGFLAPLAGGVSDSGASLLSLGDEVYGQPVDLSVTGILYAASTADGAGIDVPEDSEELLAACEEAVDAGKSYFAVAGSIPSNTGLMALSIAATRVYAQDPDWNEKRAAGDVTFSESDGWRETLDIVRTLNDTDCLQPGAEGGGFDAITNGLAQGTSLAAFIPGSNDLDALAPDAGLQVRAFPPARGAQPWLFVSPISALSVTESSDAPEAALDFLAWLAEPAQAQQFAELSGTLPATGVEGVDLSGGLYTDVADLIAEGSFSPLPRAYWPNAEVYEALSVGAQGLLTGQRTIDDVLAAMDAAWGTAGD